MRERVTEEKSAGGWAAGRPKEGPTGPFNPHAPPPSHEPSSGHDANVGAGGGYLPDLVLIVKQDGSILYLNRSSGGKTESQILGTSILDYTRIEHREAVKRTLASVFATGEAAGYECQGTAPFRENCWYQCRVAPNMREDRVVSATIVARDVTQWKRAEHGLRQQRDDLTGRVERLSNEMERLNDSYTEQEKREEELVRFRQLIDNAGEAIFITESETSTIVDLNETACRWLGESREAVLSKHVNELDLEFPLICPNGVPGHVADTRDPQRPRVFAEGVHRRGNGTSFPVEVAIARRVFAGREYSLIVARDIKERRRTEEALREAEDKFRSLFDLSRDAVYLSARDGTVADANDAALEMFGYARSELMGLAARKLYMEPQDIRAFQQHIDRAGLVRDLPVQFRRQDGQPVPGLLSATLRHGGDGSVLGYQCVIRAVAASGVHGPPPPTPEQVAAPVPKPAESLPGAASGIEAKSAPMVDQPVGKGSVLVVDREKHVLSEVRTVLERAGVSVLTARTSGAALDVYRSHTREIGAVLLGVETNIDADEIVSEVQSADPHVKIILMSEQEIDAADFSIAGDVAFIRKPIHPLALVQHVREALLTGSLD